MSAEERFEELKNEYIERETAYITLIKATLLSQLDNVEILFKLAEERFKAAASLMVLSELMFKHSSQLHALKAATK